MSTLLTRIMELAERDPAQPVSERAKQLLARIALPKRLDGEAIIKYIRRAHRTGAWRGLSQEARALLTALRGWGPIRSPTLKAVLRRILTQIELHTLRGQALYYGIIIAIKNPLYRLGELLKNTTRLLVIGISYLNNPPTLRVYG